MSAPILRRAIPRSLASVLKDAERVINKCDRPMKALRSVLKVLGARD